MVMTVIQRLSHTAHRASRMMLALCLLCSADFPLPLAAASAPAALSQAAARSGADKLRSIQEGSLARSAAVVRISEEEANSYLEYELASEYPPGLNQVRLQFTPGHLQGTADVDFDKAKQASRSPSNGLMDYLFFGVHTVTVDGSFSAVNGIGHFDLETVSLDGVVLPESLVNYLIERFLLPHYPALAIDRPFPLPFSIDRVQVERGGITLAGRAIPIASSPWNPA